MPSNRDWTLIANFADKTLIRNHLVYQLSRQLRKDAYSPRDKFVELYLNSDYVGVYQLTETIKEDQNRVNLTESPHPFLVEFDNEPKPKDIIITSQMGKIFNLHYPKSPTESNIKWLSTKLNDFENYLQTKKQSYRFWINSEDYIRHYWIQEFSNNTDGDFNRSVFFSINSEDKISMGPVWDFDLSFGNHFTEDVKSYQAWRIRKSYWNHYLFSDSSFLFETNQYWKQNRIYFESTLDSIESYKSFLQKAAKNNFKRWNILKDTKNWWRPKAYNSYNEATEDLKEWISNRIKWINTQINQYSP